MYTHTYIQTLENITTPKIKKICITSKGFHVPLCKASLLPLLIASIHKSVFFHSPFACIF